MYQPTEKYFAYEYIIISLPNKMPPLPPPPAPTPPYKKARVSDIFMFMHRNILKVFKVLNIIIQKGFSLYIYITGNAL